MGCGGGGGAHIQCMLLAVSHIRQLYSNLLWKHESSSIASKTTIHITAYRRQTSQPAHVKIIQQSNFAQRQMIKPSATQDDKTHPTAKDNAENAISNTYKLKFKKGLLNALIY